MNTFRIVVIAMSLVLIVPSCKKDESPTSSNNPSQTCNYTTDVVAVNGVTANIIRPYCHVLGGSYFAEFHTDTSAAPTGIAMLFSGTSAPAAGDYTIVTDVGQVASGKVFVEYYDPTTAWDGTAGTVKVTVSGSQTVITFCSLTLTANPGNNKTVSVRATCNL